MLEHFSLKVGSLPHPTLIVFVSFVIVSCEQCEQLYTSSQPSGQTGNFKTPGYPSPYPNNLQCRYTFQGTRDERIKITFSDFDLEIGTNAGWVAFLSLSLYLCFPLKTTGISLLVPVSTKLDYCYSGHNVKIFKHQKGKVTVALMRWVALK